MLSMEEVYREHSKTVYRYLLSQTRDAGLSEELTQETFYQAIKTVEKFDGSCKVSTWLCAIAKNLLLAERRKHPPSAELDEALASPDSVEEEVVSGAGNIGLLRKLHTLEGEAREVLYLRFLGGLSFREIGEVFGKTENWARVTCYRGKEKLKKELEKDEQ